MTDTTVSDAVAWPQDDGSGVSDGSEDYNSAMYHSLLAKMRGDTSYVGEDTSGTATLQFANIDTTNDEVDVNAGYAYIVESGNTVQSGSQTTYDTTLPNSAPYVVILPTNETGLSLGTGTNNDLWLFLDPTSNDSVKIRHGSGLSAPSNPSVKLGTVDTSDGSSTRANDLAPVTAQSISTDKATINGQLVEKVDEFVNTGRTTNAVTASFSLSTNTRYQLWVDVADRDAGRLIVHFSNDDASGNGHYQWTDLAGTTNGNQDEIELVDFVQFEGATGHVDLFGRNVATLNSRLSATGFNSRAQSGSWSGAASDATSIQITATGGLEGSSGGNRDSIIELWRAI